MTSPLAHLPAARLNPGDLIVADRPALLVTILGSCVAATMFHRRLGLGAMCHGMLPESDTDGGRERFRYVSDAIRHMAEQFRAAGAKPQEIEVKLFGGADVLQGDDRRGCSPATVGARNVQAALEALEAEGLTVRASELRGCNGRKILFNTETGDVFLKRLGRRPCQAPSPWRELGAVRRKPRGAKDRSRRESR
jgi:chemotaxis protein CheD